MNQSLPPAAIIVGAALSLTTVPAWSSSFSYSFINARVGEVVLDERLRFAGDRYEDFSQVAVEGSYQILDFAAVGMEGILVSNDQGNTEISAETRQGYLAFPFPVGQRFDLVPRAGYRVTDHERCAADSCSRDDNEGATYSGRTRLWVEPDKVELTASYLDADIEAFDSEQSVGLGIWVNEDSRMGLDYTDQTDRSTFELTYQYSW